MKKNIANFILVLLMAALCALGVTACRKAHTPMYVEAVPPTCGEAGHIAYWYCAECGKYYADEGETTELSSAELVVPATGEHTVPETWETVKRADCEEDGLEAKNCTVCGKELETRKIEAFGHLLEEHKQILADCTEGGVKAHWQCTRCKDYFMGESTESLEKVAAQEIVIPAAKHDGSGSWQNDEDDLPTCVHLGTQIKICPVCNRVCETRKRYGEHVYSVNQCIICKEYRPSIGLEYALRKDKASFELVGMGGCIDTVVTVASIYDGLPVTHIAAGALSRQPIERVTLSSHLETVGERAFEDCISLRSVTFGEKITEIAAYMFRGCGSLKEVNLPDQVKSIGECAFEESGLQHISFGGVVSIGAHAFESCTMLTALNTGNVVSSIGDYAFLGCSSLESAFFGLNVVEIGEGAFENCSKLAQYGVSADNADFFSQSGILYNKAKTEFVLFPAVISGEIVIPAGITEIPASAFENQHRLTRVGLPEGLLKIGGSAFYDCALTELTLPDSITEVGEEAFGSCRIQTATVPVSIEAGRFLPGNLTTLTLTGSGALSASAFEDFVWLKTVTLQAGITKIGQYAFNRCRELTEITLCNTLAEIEDHAFYRCAALTAAEIPASVTKIGKEAFFACTELTSVTFGEGSELSFIGERAFSGATKLSACILPQGVSVISEGAFEYCESLSEFSLPENLQEVGFNAFLGMNEGAFHWDNENKYLGSGENDFFYLAAASEETGLTFTVHEDTKLIGYSAFYGNNELIAISIPAKVRSVCAYAFYGCLQLNTVTFEQEEGKGVQKIFAHAFENCGLMGMLLLPETVTKIGVYAFAGNTALTEALLPVSLTEIDDEALEAVVLQNIYYGGTEEQWSKIPENGNTTLSTAEIYYYSEQPPALNEEGTAYAGNFWRYDIDGITPLSWVYTAE